MFCRISTRAGIMNVAQAIPSIRPVKNLEKWVFSQIPKTPSDQSIAIGTSDKNSQNLAGGSVSSSFRQSG